MRQACGGAGYLVSSGICSFWQESTPYPTYEGVNIVMLQQSTRYLFKQVGKVERGKKCQGYFAYLNETEALCSSKSEARNPEDFITWDHLTKALTTRAAYFIRETRNLMKSDNSDKKTQENEVYALELQILAKYHLNYVLFEMAKKRVTTHKFVDENIRFPLETLVKLFAVKQLVDDSQCLFETGFFGKGSGQLRDAAYKKLLKDLRPNMIGLVEFLSGADASMQTTIGNYYGDIYEKQLEVAKASRLNKNEVPPYYETLMKPTMTMRKPNL